MTALLRHWRFQRSRGLPAAEALRVARARMAARDALTERHPDVAADYDRCDDGDAS